MKRLLMATAAAVALAVAAPLATAQYTTPPPATAPYTTPVPDDSLTPQDESLSAQQDRTATQSQAETITPVSPGVQDPTAASPTQLIEAQGQSDAVAVQPQSRTGDGALEAQTHTGAEPGVQAQSYGSQSDADQSGATNTTTLASLERHARDAGMDRLPMTATEVCAPRELTLTTSGTRLSRDKQHQLINAADRASVCEFQRVVINSPNGRADEARELLAQSGVDSDLIDVQDTDAGGLEVEMHFAGVATSNEMYAQIFNPQQYASYQPSTAAPSTTTQSHQPGSAQPDSVIPNNGAEPPSASPADEMSNEGMTPTSSEPAVQPDMLDI